MKLFFKIIIVFAFFVLLGFERGMDLNPERYIGYLGVLVIWGFTYILFLLYPKLKNKISFLLLFLGSIEALWGLGQLYGFFKSQHPFFLITGSFYNPGPYGGFLGCLVPLALHLWLENKGKGNKVAYLGVSVIILTVLVLPATLSRAAWVACLFGCGFVLFIKFKPWVTQKKMFLMITPIFITTLIFVLLFFFNLKKDSAEGRLFMAKITTKAIVESKFAGGGIGSFPSLYAEAQKKYFKEEYGTAQERKIAGSPEYAFNEYLQLAVEQGVFALLLFLLFLGLCVWQGIKNRQIGFVSSLLALSVFALFSYPFEFILFLFLFIVLTTSILAHGEDSAKIRIKYRYVYRVFLIILMGFFIFLLTKQGEYYNARKKWKEFSISHHSMGYKQDLKQYEEFYKLLNHEPHFVFKYAQLLYDLKEYDKAVIVCKRGLEISSDPMFYNIMGKNYTAIGEYSNAENCYHSSVNLLPNRIYPYFLLVKLYNTSGFKDEKKLRKYADSVLYKIPKIYSPAIAEMREDVKKILNENGIK